MIYQIPLVLLGLCSVPKDDQAFSSAEAVYGSPLMLPGMFLDAPEFPSEVFKSQIRSVLQSFSAPPNHYFRATAPAVPASLRTATHVFVCKDSLLLSILCRGQYLVLQKNDKYCTLQLCLQLDSVLRFFCLTLRLVLCPLFNVLLFLEETFLEWPENQLQLHLLVNLVDDAGGDLCGELKTTFLRL